MTYRAATDSGIEAKGDDAGRPTNSLRWLERNWTTLASQGGGYVEPPRI